MAQWYLLRNSTGKKSVSYTMMVITFTVCTIWLSLSMFQKVFHLDVREFDATAATIWFAPLAGLYFGRRWQTTDVVGAATALSEAKKKATAVVEDVTDDTEDKT